jgi:transposase
VRVISIIERKIFHHYMALITNEEIYKNETEYQIGDIQKRKIIEADTFLVNKCINLISGIIAIMRKEIVSIN